VYEPKRPTLVAAAACGLWIAVLSLPMLTGQWLGSPVGDFNPAGFASRTWGAEWWHRLGHVPLWEPLLFGGMPYIGAGHGDLFYPTSFLRLVFPIAAVFDFGFILHYLLAGLFTYALVRRLGLSWSGSVLAGLAYELTGLMASYPSPGHDGKLFACAALPLALLALVMALRDKQWEGYGILALAVALGLLGHFQIAYYLLVVAGLFALYLTFHENTDEPLSGRLVRLGIALPAVLLGFGLAAVQVLPFIQYIPFSPRAQGYHGFAGSTSYAIPWNHVPEFFLKNFVGARETYWGTNPLKFHSEYLGLPVIALAALGALTSGRRRLVLWLGGIGLLFLLISLGASTPFYQLFWAIMPMIKKTRAPGMAFFVVGLVCAIFAGFGVERLERQEGIKAARAWLVVAGAVMLLAIAGAFGGMAVSMAGPRAGTAQADAGAILVGALTSGLALALLAAAAIAAIRGRLPAQGLALALVLVVGGDLWLNARGFWIYQPDPHATWLRADPITQRLAATPRPYRVLDFGGYGSDALMAFDVQQVRGYHGNELRYYDELLGRNGDSFENLRYLRLWDLLAVRYVIMPSSGTADSIPGFNRILTSVTTSDGVQADLLERTDVQPYARVVPAAVKIDSSAVVPTLLDPRMDVSRLVLFDEGQPVAPRPISALPPPSPSQASVAAWEPGQMTVALDPAPPAASYVLVSENWFPTWEATVDGRSAPVLRGDGSLMVVSVPAGARQVSLTFRSPVYTTGRDVSVASLAGLLVAVLVPIAARRRRRA
jgi:hypothetical protein